jgi:hypothetical protein
MRETLKRSDKLCIFRANRLEANVLKKVDRVNVSPDKRIIKIISRVEDHHNRKSWIKFGVDTNVEN